MAHSLSHSVRSSCAETYCTSCIGSFGSPTAPCQASTALRTDGANARPSPLTKPACSAYSTCPLIESRVASQNQPMRRPSRPTPPLFDRIVPGSTAESAADHGSPYSRIPRPFGSASTEARTAFIVSTSIRPIRSKRNPSMWYSRAQYVTESTMYRPNIACSLAVSLPQPEPLASAPSSVRRQK